MMGTNNKTQSEQEKSPPLKPLVRELSADMETPVSVYLKVAEGTPSYLLESVSGGEQVARYSFIGLTPQKIYLLNGREIEVYHQGDIQSIQIPPNDSPLDFLRQVLKANPYQHHPGLPRFAGGLVGFISYEAIRHFEPTVPVHNRGYPDAIFFLSDILIAFDHAFGRLLLIANVPAGERFEEERRVVEDRLDQIQARLDQPLGQSKFIPPSGNSQPLDANFSREDFIAGVLRAKSHIRAGDIFQVVLSQRLSRTTHARPFNIYRALRRTNPSPYMFFFDFGNIYGHEPLKLIGASPEMHVRLEAGRASLRPIAGTRARGGSLEEDAALEQELRTDPKELAEHVMLVDLARNDLGRVCRYGSVRVSEQFTVERYSHVMHLVSHVEGDINPGQDAFSLMKATFPAGTVSGAPKVRAMQIIKDIEKEDRGPYAGAVGYFSYDGSMDTCITIRTVLMEENRVSVQAGAGIVADSDPEAEYLETMNKARALAEAVDIAEAMERNSVSFTVAHSNDEVSNSSGGTEHDSGH